MNEYATSIRKNYRFGPHIIKILEALKEKTGWSESYIIQMALIEYHNKNFQSKDG